ncbi:MAG: hypothetical protein U5L07_07800 [Desulfobacterales bacterium]|nr:hypothetical protein [Desulfobacterales bacterium]
MPDNRTNTYYNHRHQMATGDLIEVAGSGIISKLIRCRTKKPVNHTMRVIRLTDYDTEHVYVLQAAATGIVLTRLSRYVENHSGRIYWLPMRREWDGMRKTVGRVSLKYVGTPYDYRSLLRNVLGHVSANARAMFCSEYISIVDKESSLPVRRKKAPWPGEFAGTAVYDDRPARIK